jgi:hypothetical protein
MMVAQLRTVIPDVKAQRPAARVQRAAGRGRRNSCRNQDTADKPV